MDSKIKILLDKINIGEDYFQYFNDAKITKIKVNSKNNNWNIFIDKENLLPIDVYKLVEENKHLLDETANKIEIIYNIRNQDMETLLTYYDYLLELLSDDLGVTEIYRDSLKLEDDFLLLVVSNEIEKERIKSVLPKIEKFYKKLSYNFNIDVVIRKEENIYEEIQKELNSIEMPKVKEEKPKEVKEKPQKKQYRREAVEENNVIGRGIKEDPIKIKTIIGEDNNVVIECKVFGLDFFESSRTDFKIITLKVTDYSDSMYVKVFAREDEEYQRIKGELKEGNWYKIRGASVNDKYSKELVINARDILKVEHNENSVKDLSEEKRVELHCHTKMSQMDGLADEVDVIKQAMKFGHKAVAITDHNGVQGFPHVFNFVTSHNKNLKEGEEPFKAIYGAELVMIDDSVDIVVRPNDKVMLDELIYLLLKLFLLLSFFHILIKVFQFY